MFTGVLKPEKHLHPIIRIPERPWLGVFRWSPLRRRHSVPVVDWIVDRALALGPAAVHDMARFPQSQDAPLRLVVVPWLCSQLAVRGRAALKGLLVLLELHVEVLDVLLGLGLDWTMKDASRLLGLKMVRGG